MADNNIREIIKRNGDIVPFDEEKITTAIAKAAQAVGADHERMPRQLTEDVAAMLNEQFGGRRPTIEEIQDVVEHTLIKNHQPAVAKAYIIYRHERAKARGDIPAQDFSKSPQHSISHIVKRDSTVVPFDQEKITVAIYKAAGSLGQHDRALCERISNEVVWLLAKSFSQRHTPGVEEIQDIIEQVLIKRGYARIAKAYILYREERSKQRRKQKSSDKKETIPYKKLWEALLFNTEHGCETVEKLNLHVRDGSIVDLIEAAEKSYHEEVAYAAEEIIRRKGDIRMVIIAGPSSSGKTTTTIKLAEHLEREGLRLVALNIDNYYHDVECHPQDEFGDYDYETPEALDLPLINRHLEELLAGKTIAMPRYDFKLGKRLEEREEIEIADDQIVLLDTLHGLYDGLTRSVPDTAKFKLYIETLSQLKDVDGRFVRWTDIRLLRRMIRDNSHRGCNPKQTIEHWHYVRRSELKHIIPYIPKANFIVNGSLPYELCVFKKYAFPYFKNFIEVYEDNPHRQDAFIRARRIYTLLDTIEALEESSCVPKNSVLREFIGGSEYVY